MASKKNFGCFKILMILFIVLMAMVAFWSVLNFRSGPTAGTALVSPSVETTVITGPLDSNGDVDYAQALNDKYSEGVTSENNSLAKSMEAIGPVVREKALPIEFFEKLGIAPLPEDGNYFVEFEKWPVGESPQLESVQNARQAQLHPWSPSQFPKVEKWYQQNKPAMEMVREGLSRSYYYLPLASNQSNTVWEMDLTVISSLPSMNQYFSISAMRHLEKGETEQALNEVLEMYRLGSHIGRGSTIVEELMAIGLFADASEAAKTIVSSQKSSSAELRNFLRRLDQIPAIDGLGKRIEYAERYAMLDAIVALGRGDTNQFASLMGGQGGSQEGNSLAKIGLKTVDFEQALLVANEWFDTLIESAKVENDLERLKAFESYDALVSQKENEVASLVNLSKTLIGGRQVKGQLVGEFLICMFTPACGFVIEKEVRHKATLKMVKIAAAAAAYKADQGKYPKTLDLLTPTYLAKPLLDPFSNEAFEYRPLEQGIVLSSVGIGGADDGGPDNFMLSDLVLYWGVKAGSKEATELGLLVDPFLSVDKETMEDATDGKSNEQNNEQNN